ncbi:gametogenetin [Platysternon megacephalum]|uniref:Gametogenetin n=1 Tax=Platysternon megacephalum TaxID=55544 RepID=A0A4D9DUG9_9SAUR|nr:gametogenetin [Platysternon megacephalum]
MAELLALVSGIGLITPEAKRTWTWEMACAPPGYEQPFEDQVDGIASNASLAGGFGWQPGSAGFEGNIPNSRLLFVLLNSSQSADCSEINSISPSHGRPGQLRATAPVAAFQGSSRARDWLKPVPGAGEPLGPHAPAAGARALCFSDGKWLWAKGAFLQKIFTFVKVLPFFPINIGVKMFSFG